MQSDASRSRKPCWDRRLQQEAELHAQFFGAAAQPEDLVRLVGKRLQGQRELRQRGLERQKFVAVFLQKFTAVLKLEAAFARRKRGKEKLRALVDAGRRRQQRRR